MKLTLAEGFASLQMPFNAVVEASGAETADNGLLIIPEKSNDNYLSVDVNDHRAVIRYPRTVCFFRALTKLLSEDGWHSFTETLQVEDGGIMLDLSRNAVLREEMLREMILHQAMLGLDTLFLYLEDTYELDGHPYFGAFRSRMTRDELKRLDSYAQAFGVELVPCIQTLAHLETFLRWPESGDLRDTSDVLYVGMDKVYELVEDMISMFRSCLSTKRIHVGMDEAHNLGLGRLLEQKGYQDRLGLFKDHLAKVREICARYDFSLMMWSDMYFKLSGGSYYSHDPGLEFRSDALPAQDVTPVYWDYYNDDPDIYRTMVGLHRKLSPKTAFAAGGWTWNGIAPAYAKADLTIRTSMSVMKETQVPCCFLTLWMDDGAETPFATALYPMIRFAEECYTKEPEEDSIEKMVSLFGLHSIAELETIGDLNLPEKTPEIIKRCPQVAKQLLWQDPVMALFDKQYESYDLSAHYAELEKKFAASEIKGDPWGIYGFYRSLAAVLKLKSDFGRRLVQAYQSEDKEALLEIETTEIPEIVRLLDLCHEKRRAIWFTESGPFGYENLEIRFGGIRARLLSTAWRLKQYRTGAVDTLPELLEPRLPWESNEKDGHLQPVGMNCWRYMMTTGTNW